MGYSPSTPAITDVADRLGAPVLSLQDTGTRPGAAAAGGFTHGYVLGLLSGVAASVGAFEPNLILKAILLLFVPFALCWVFTRRMAFSLAALITIELLFGGRGHWGGGGMDGGGIQVRGILLAVVIAYSILSVRRVPRLAAIAVLLGLILPLWFISYAVVFRGVAPGIAFGDARFFFVLLAYFPLLSAVKQQGQAYTGLLAGGITALSALILAVVFAGADLHAFVLWFGGNVSRFPNGMSRLSLTVHSIMPLGVFLGFGPVVAEPKARALSIVTGIASALVLATSFSRAIILSLFFIWIVSLLPRSSRSLGRKLFGAVICAAMGLGLAMLMARLSPEGTQRFENVLLRSNGDIGGERIAQSRIMLDEWSHYPLFGKGIGSPLDGYIRFNDGLLFELQYHTLLYKTGIVGLAPLLTLLLLMSLWWAQPAGLAARPPLFQASVGCVLTIAIAGSMNPYLTSAYFTFLLALALAARTSPAVGLKSPQSRGRARRSQPIGAV